MTTKTASKSTSKTKAKKKTKSTSKTKKTEAKKAASATTPKKAKTPASTSKSTTRKKPSNTKSAKPSKGRGNGGEKRVLLIQQMAYYIAEKRGFEGGDPVQDWLMAERQVDEMLKGNRI